MQDGRFWLPGEQTTKVLGRLEYSPSHGVVVHLPESPLPPLELRGPSPPVEVLHGESLDGWPLTLLDGSVIRPDAISMSTQGVANVSFAALIRGPHVHRKDDVVGTMAHVGLQHLREFLRGGLVDQALLKTEPEDRDGDFCTVNLPWGSLGLYVAGGPAQQGRDEVRYVVRAHAQLHFDKQVTLHEADAAVAALRDLITFATRKPSIVKHLHLLGAQDPDDVHWQHRREFKVIRAPEIEPEFLSERGPYALLLNPATVPDGADVIARWFALRDRLDAVWSLFFAILADPWMTAEARLLNLTSFAEGYHRTLHDAPPFSDEDAARAVETMLDALPDRRHREHFRPRLAFTNSQSQRARIRWLVRRALDVASGWDIDARRLSDQAVDTRNWLTHWGDRGPCVQEGAELIQLARRLYVVLATNLMLDLGLSEDVVAAQLGSGLRLDGLP